MAGDMDSCDFRALEGAELGKSPLGATYRWAFFSMVCCGMLNNLPYCMLSGASQNIARSLHMEDETTMLSAIMNFASLLATIISSRWLLQFTFAARMKIVFFGAFLSFAGIVAATFATGIASFALAALAAIAAGVSCVFGEVTIVAFLKNLPAELLGGWGAGTGLAGILGSGFYLLLAGPGALPDSVIFSVMALTVPMYAVAFGHLHREATRGLEGARLASALGGSDAFAEQDVKLGSISSMKESISYSGTIMFNLTAVYCLEYFIYPGVNDRETLCSASGWFTAMWFGYNIGVTASRLSIAKFRIQSVWIFTALQFLNVLGWLLEVEYGMIRDRTPDALGHSALVLWMALVGLVGGASYANCMHLFNTKPSIPDHLREQSITVAFFLSNIGITSSSAVFSILNRTVFRKSFLYPGGC